MRRLEWSAPAEVASVECDCFWHRRIFTHIGLGPPAVEIDRQRLPLGREVVRVRVGRSVIHWRMTLKVEGCVFSVSRLVSGPNQPVMFDATANAGDGPVRLEPHNDHSRRTTGGGDPTLIWDLPPRVGRVAFPAGSELVVWPEAWWWHLDERGRDPLQAAESIDAVDHDTVWPLPG